jgi:hypothetical protein
VKAAAVGGTAANVTAANVTAAIASVAIAFQPQTGVSQRKRSGTRPWTTSL